ncbi:MAG: ATP-dependent DNA helicase RecG [Pyramidobacter sp.]|jgi:ATP-dependent DNA helicase RecG
MNQGALRLEDSVTAIRGVGEARALLLQRLGITTVEDLIYFFPRRYEDRRQIVEIKDLVPGGPPQAFRARVVAVEQRTARHNRSLHLIRVCLSDGKNVAWALWFNRWNLRNILREGMELALYGSLEPRRTVPELINPEFEILDADDPKSVGRIVPVYATTAGLNEKWLRRIIDVVIDSIGPLIPETLPAEVVAKYHFMEPSAAVREMHRPTDEKTFRAARQRLVFEEFFLLQTGLALRHRLGTLEKKAVPLTGAPLLFNKFLDSLTFELTDDQKKVISEISSDMRRSVPMNRLLQGDVGSGKTVVAVAAMLQALDSGVQAALMAPTAVLAQQHVLTLRRWLAPLGIEPALLTGGLAPAERRRVYEGLSSGEIRVVVGTHALIQSAVKFRHLGLIVIDEQHRFGVLQRKALNSKAGDESPHTLVMTATPIPRTLALSVYGDLAVSTIRQMPAHRKPIKSVWIGDNRLPGMLKFLDGEIEAGRQVYWVCPLIEESENFDAAPLQSRYEKLCTAFPNRRVAMLHGRMNDREKTAVMQDFTAGKTDILASTTVIEVGVDVPNASVMVVENAERFGLSQLHQLRGRVGRGPYQSWCILYADPKNIEAEHRLDQFCALSDGFAIAEADMAMRGPGEFCGVRQHGLTDFHVADLIRDGAVMEVARREAFEVVKHADPARDFPLLMQAVMKRYGKMLDIARTA